MSNSDDDDDRRISREEEERERNRREVEKRPRQWKVASDDDESDGKRRHRRSRSASRSSSDSHKHRRKHHADKKRKKHKKKKKHHKKKRHRRDYSSDEYSSSDEESSRDDRHRDKKRKKEKKRKRDKADKTTAPAGAGTFGKYGIIKPSDFYKQQRSFEMWMAQVKGIPTFTGPKWELQKYFAEYCEDYNTATMPHVKYYNYDEWEMQQYKKKQQETSAKGGAIADEAQHRAEMLQQRREKEQAELALVKARMSHDKVEEMKHQAFLKSTMAHAFKTGDEETRQRLQKKLEPEDERNKKATAHPWAR